MGDEIPSLSNGYYWILEYWNGQGGQVAIPVEVADSCETPESPITLSSSTPAVIGDVVFGLAILVFFGSFMLIGFAFNSINSKKPWK